jgi:Putative prokaryotic signal transducing protein
MGGSENERLAERYRNMTDDELEELVADRDSLSDAARSALRRELLTRRGSTASLDSVAQQAPSISSKLVTIRQYVNVPEALLAKSILDSAGIESFLADQTTIRMDWFLSNALGGIKLRVREEDAQAALQLLDNSPEKP